MKSCGKSAEIVLGYCMQAVSTIFSRLMMKLYEK